MIRGLNKLTNPAGLGYVMSSYTSHPSGLVQAHEDAKQVAGALLSSGLVVFVPIAYGPAIEPHIINWGDDKKYIQSHEFWMPVDERFYERCDYALIATTPGWHKSKGMAIELSALTRAGIPIHFYDVNREQVYNLLEYGELHSEEVDDFIALSIEMNIPNYLTESVSNQCEALQQTLAESMLRDALA